MTFEAVQDLTGGTGRFAAADGTAELAGTTRLNLITGSGSGELTLDGVSRASTTPASTHGTLRHAKRAASRSLVAVVQGSSHFEPPIG